jgi:hypothetical protein
VPPVSSGTLVDPGMPIASGWSFLREFLPLLLLEVLAILLAHGLLVLVRRVTRGHWVEAGHVDLTCVSVLQVIVLAAWLGTYEIRIVRDFVGDTLGLPSRGAIGALVVGQYLVIGADRVRRGLSSFSQAAPFVAAPAAAILTVWRGNWWGAVLAFVATTFYLIGYFRDDAYGKKTFGMAMFVSATLGVVSLEFGPTGLGEFLLVAAGIIATVRSIIEFIKDPTSRNPRRRKGGGCDALVPRTSDTDRGPSDLERGAQPRFS